MSRHTDHYYRCKAEHRCISCGDDLPAGWQITRCSACHRRMRAEARRRYRRLHPPLTARQKAERAARFARKRLEKRYGPMVDAFVREGRITRSSLLAFAQQCDQFGRWSGWQTGYRAGRAMASAAAEGSAA